MGAYVSISDCQSHYNITVNCQYNGTDSPPTISGYGLGQVPTDADVAGVGIIHTFIGTTSFALFLSLVGVFWSIWKALKLRPHHGDTGSRKKLSLSELCEELVLNCSDVQIFTGGAYALTLRYFKGCTITAYHYDIVANMLLLTCATHLMSVTIVRDYWKYPWLGVIRVIVCLGVFTITGLLLANQNANTGLPFPSFPPAANETADPILMPAACFQQGNSQLLPTLSSSFGKSAANAFLFSQPGNNIPGWNNYLIILLWYIIACIVDGIRFWRRGMANPTGRRAEIIRRVSTGLSINRSGDQLQLREVEAQATDQRRLLSWRCFFHCLFSLYLIGGISISAWTVGQSARYITALRSWAKNSGWLQLESGLQSAEDDATSFGQLVPIFLNLLLLFTIAQMVSEKGCISWGSREFDRFGDVLPTNEGEDNHNNGSLMPRSNGVPIQLDSLQMADKTPNTVVTPMSPMSNIRQDSLQTADGTPNTVATPMSPMSAPAADFTSYTPTSPQFATTTRDLQGPGSTPSP